jgi:hypothetical protein
MRLPRGPDDTLRAHALWNRHPDRREGARQVVGVRPIPLANPDSLRRPQSTSGLL